MDLDGEQFCSVEVALEDGDSDIITAGNETDMTSADINELLDVTQEGPAEQRTRSEASDDRPVGRTQHKRSLIWRYFERLDGLDAANCRICKEKIKSSYGSTSNMHRHLSKKHPKVFSELVANRQQPPPLNSSQDSKSNSDTDGTFWMTEQRQVKVEVALADGDSDIITAGNETDMNSADISELLDVTQEGPAEQTTRSEASDDRPVGRTQHKRSLIWRYFAHLNSLNAASCRICMEKIKSSYGSTSNMHRHLSKMHPKVFSELVAKRRQPPPLNSSQDSKTNGGSDETFWMTEQRQVPVEVALEDGDSDIITAGNETDMTSADISELLDVSQEGPAEQRTRSEASVNRLVGRTQHKRSLIWRYYAHLNSLNAARCRICKKKLKYSYGSTSNLHRHLSKRHPNVFSELVANRQQPPPLNSFQNSKSNGGSDETFWMTEQRQVPGNETGMISADINELLDVSQEGPAEQRTCSEASVNRLVGRKQHKRSLIWRYFEHLDSLNAARCHICKKKVQSSYGSTSNMRRHLSKRHPKVFSEVVPNRQQPPPPLNSSQKSKTNGDTGETNQRRVPGALKVSGPSEGVKQVFRRERELIESLRKTQREEARALEQQRELLEKLRAAHAREAAAEMKKIESLRKAQQEEADELSRQREELQKEKAELQKKWEEFQ